MASDVDAILDTVSAQWRSSPEFRSRFLTWLAGIGLVQSVRLRMAHRAQTAESILKTMPPSDTQFALRERFGVSRATAYRDIGRAYDLRQGRLFD